MDIVLYMREEDFYHKTDFGTFFWSMGRVPKKFVEGDKVYIAVKLSKGVLGSPEECRVMGFVVCTEFNPEDLNGETIVWEGDSWRRTNSIPCKPFRGFRYKWWN